MRLAIVASHPVQYYSPLFRAIADEIDLEVFYSHRASREDQARAGFDVEFEWDVDLLSGYQCHFVQNVSRRPGLHHFYGVDTPSIARELRDGRFDAVLLLGWYLKTFIQSLFAAKQLGLPVMVRGDSHLGTPRSWMKRTAKSVIYPLFLRQFDAALIVGERNRAYWEHYGYPPERMFDSPHCVDTEWFLRRGTSDARRALRSRLKIPPGVPLALFVGKLIECKRPLDLIEAAARVRQGGGEVEVAVAGSGPLRRSLEQRAHELGVPIHMLGFRNQTELPEVYAASDIVVLPSSSDTWGLVVNEALACGRPVLLSDAVGCAPDIAKHLGRGTVFSPGNIGDLARKLEAIIISPPEAADIRETSNSFSLESAASGIVDAARYLKRR